ncbi:MAG: tetratricopeptide repeat protein, partial [Cyanobacteria bacterium P01_E01_bin.6]
MAADWIGYYGENSAPLDIHRVMPVITIREQKQQSDKNSGFAATLSIDNQSQYNITIQPPFTDRQEQELEFYFEGWIRFPFDNQVMAQRAGNSIQTYGEELFNQVFKQDPDAYSDYQQACRHGLSEVRVEIEGTSPDFQALHWEALKDPNQPKPLAVESVFTRKRFQRGVTPIELRPSPTINLLVVTARPDEEADVGYRTISRPLIDAIQQARLRVNIELLRPGTFQELSEHLEGKAGHYHIVHFDAHGGLLTYQQFQQGVENDRYVFQQRYGRSDMAPYDGVKAFLFLEGEQKGNADPVEAEELADLLTNKGIPICILNACQSGKQVRSAGATSQSPNDAAADSEADASAIIGAHGCAPLQGIDGRETSLGSRLMAAGVQMVVAMGYSVTVTAAALMMKTLYSQLFAQQGIPEAIRLGRKELYNQKNRRVYFNQMVELEDWLLPVVYANREVDLKLEELEGRAKADYLMQRRQRYRFSGATYGFVGRDLEILKIEKALLRHNILLLRGMGGTGKTTLLNYLRDWWQTTHFVNDVFYFGYDESAHTLQHILREIGKTLYPDTYGFAAFEAMPIAAQMEDIAEKLRTQPYGVMLDNLESVTGHELAIQNTLPEAERNAIREFLLLLRGGNTTVVLGSRRGEEWLADAFTQDGQAHQYHLRGLDPESRSVLAEKILAAQVNDANHIAELRLDAGFQRLMNLLAGYPLAMEVVLANLARQTPQQILEGLNAADVDLAVGLNPGGEDKTNNILKCVEYSHSNLSPDAQKLLVCLAPFNSFIFRPLLEQYGLELQQREPFQAYDFQRFDEAVQEAIHWGLLSSHESSIPGFLSIQPIFPYFLRTKLNDLNAVTRDALYDGFKAHYQGLARQYNQLMGSKDPQERQMGIIFCQLEYENLYRALQICLVQHNSVSIFFCLDKYFELTQDIQSNLKLALEVDQALREYPAEWKSGEGAREYVITLNLLGYCYLMTKQYAAAKEIYGQELQAHQAMNDRYSQASTYHNLGSVAQDLREYEQARSHYQQALDINIEFNDRYSQARTYHNLGRVAQELREYEQARSHYQQALDINIEFNDRYSKARTYHQLGRVAQDL